MTLIEATKLVETLDKFYRNSSLGETDCFILVDYLNETFQELHFACALAPSEVSAHDRIFGVQPKVSL